MPTKATKKNILNQIQASVPPKKICQNADCTISAVKRSVLEAIGEGKIKKSDLYFYIPDEIRIHISELRKKDSNTKKIKEDIYEKGYDEEYVDLFNSLNHEDKFYGDMYEYLRDIEINLHDLVKEGLKKEYGNDELKWWRQIKEPIRKSCAARREGDPEPTEKFNYTNLIDLKKIVSNHFRIFQKLLPPDLASDKPKLKSDLDKLNYIRNSVMHPVKDREWSTNDLQFVRKFYLRLIAN